MSEAKAELTTKESIERDVEDILKDNPKRTVPVSRSEAYIIATLVLVLGEIPEWVDGAFPIGDLEHPLGYANDLLRVVLENENVLAQAHA